MKVTVVELGNDVISTNQLEVGQMAIITYGVQIGEVFLKTDAGLVCLDNPHNTWMYPSPMPDFKCRLLPPGSQVIIDVV